MLDSTQSASFTAALTLDEVAQGEQAAQSYGVTRRLAYVLLAKDSAELQNLDAETVEAFREVQESLCEYLRWREHETELLFAAQARLAIILNDHDRAMLQ